MLVGKMEILTSKQLINLAENKNLWNHWGRWVQPPLSICTWPLWSKRKIYMELGLPPVSGYSLQFDGHYIDFKEDYGKIVKLAEIAAEKQDDALFRNFVNVMEKVCKHQIELAKKLDSLDAPLQQKLEAFFDSANQMVVPWIGYFHLNAGLDLVFAKELEKHGLAQIALTKLYELKKPTMLMQQEREAREFAEYIRDSNLLHLLGEKPKKIIDLLNKNHRHLAKRILAHLEEFEWVGTHHCWGDPLTSEKLFAQIKEMPKKKEEKHVKLPPLSKKLIWLINWQNELAFWRQYVAETSDVGFFKARGILTQAGRKLDLAYYEIIWLTDREIMAGLKNGKIPSKKILEERKKGYGYTETESDELFVYGEELRKIVDNLVPKTDLSIRQFSGTIGSRGFVAGIAFVCFTPHEAKHLKKGEILVCPQTTPDFVVFMKRASAIITDEGGITCHAAIVSRELGIPAVVGTKVATRVLKTGDRIEVDANNGIIKRL
jgi:phosphohistidine swiveling domain-containing protein